MSAFAAWRYMRGLAPVHLEKAACLG